MEIIFERFYTRNDEDLEGRSNLFLRLESEQQTPLALVRPISATIFEGFSFASPVITITFIDGLGMYFNAEKIKISDDFFLSIGRSLTEYNRIPVKIANIALSQTTAGSSSRIAYKITFVHNSWNEILNKRRNRGWANLRYSDVVNLIAQECGYETIDIEPSRGIKPSIIQPYWDNVSFIKWIQKHSVSNVYDDHYEFGCDINNRFFYKTVSKMIEDQSPKTKSDNTRTFILESRDSVDSRSVSESYFSSFSSTEFYMDSVINGAGGINALHYDWDKGEIISQDVKLSNSNSIMLSDYYSIHGDNEVSHRRMFTGRDNAFAEASSHVSAVALSNNKFTITMEGDRTLNIGQIVEIIIKPEQHIDETYINLPVAELYSGFYVIASVNHIVALDGSNSHITVIDIARQGYDSKTINGYVTSKLGKLNDV